MKRLILYPEHRKWMGIWWRFFILKTSAGEYVEKGTGYLWKKHRLTKKGVQRARLWLFPTWALKWAKRNGFLPSAHLTYTFEKDGEAREVSTICLSITNPRDRTDSDEIMDALYRSPGTHPYGNTKVTVWWYLENRLKNSKPIFWFRRSNQFGVRIGNIFIIVTDEKPNDD